MKAPVAMRGVMAVAALGATLARVEGAAHAADDDQGAAGASWTTSQKTEPRTRPRTGLIIVVIDAARTRVRSVPTVFSGRGGDPLTGIAGTF